VGGDAARTRDRTHDDSRPQRMYLRFGAPIGTTKPRRVSGTSWVASIKGALSSRWRRSCRPATATPTASSIPWPGRPRAIAIAGHLNFHRSDPVSTVLALVPLRGLPLPRPAGSCLSLSEVLGHLRVQGGLEHILVSWLSRPFGPTSSLLVPSLEPAAVLPAAVDPGHSPRNQVFLTSSVLPAKLPLGLSDQDQIHRFSDSPDVAPSNLPLMPSSDM
jgi:hypothetical protein